MKRLVVAHQAVPLLGLVDPSKGLLAEIPHDAGCKPSLQQGIGWIAAIPVDAAEHLPAQKAFGQKSHVYRVSVLHVF